MPLPIITTAADREMRLMLDRAQRQNLMLRQQDAADRLLILQGNFKELVQARIGRLYPSPEAAPIRQGIQRAVKRTFNLLSTLSDRVCVSYKTQPVRSLKGAPQPSQDAFQAVLAESRIATRAKSWERYAFALNVAIVVPVVRRGPMGLRVDYETILPHCAEVQMSAGDPMGTPEAVPRS
jgi:hypothetical protein